MTEFRSVSAQRAEGETIDAGADIDTKILGSSDWRHQSINNMNRTSRDLALTLQPTMRTTGLWSWLDLADYAFIHAETWSLHTPDA